jgi:hypothetical protein
MYNVIMDKETVKRLQKKILKLLPAGRQNQPDILFADSCSEMARLVAGWIMETDKSNRIFILKIFNVFGTKKAHDIFAVITAGGRVYIIDPTVWQFFPLAKTILMFTAPDIDGAIDKIKKLYGGKKVTKEEFFKFTKADAKKYLAVISDNFRENVIAKRVSAPNSNTKRI